MVGAGVEGGGDVTDGLGPGWAPEPQAASAIAAPAAPIRAALLDLDSMVGAS